MSWPTPWISNTSIGNSLTQIVFQLPMVLERPDVDYFGI
jgi:hypothetical protein